MHHKHKQQLPTMPSFFKHSNSNVRGVQKSTHMHKPIFHGLKKIQSHLSGFMPQGWLFAPAPVPVKSTVFEANDCIWYYGTLYVKEAVAIARMQQMQMEQPVTAQDTLGAPAQETLGAPAQETLGAPAPETLGAPAPETEINHSVDVFDDDDADSISSGNSAFKHPRSIGKQNQLKYLKDGMRLRHVVQLNQHEWFAVFDAATNRIIRTPDGVAFDTLRQFARLHCNEVLSIASASSNVWADPHFQYNDDVDGQWHPLSNLKH